MSGKKHGDKRKIEAVSEDDKAKIKKENSVPIIDDKTKMKRSSRNASEKRRRDKLNTYINELSAMVPSCSSPHSSRKLDKSTILKLTVSYMRLHADLLSPSPNESTVSWKPAFLSNEELGTLMLEALDGFLFVLTVTGRVLYVSHTVAPLLGHLQNTLIGRSLFDIVHEDDKAILNHTLSSNFNSEISESSSSTGNKAKVSFSIRMLHGGLNSYELVHCSGNVRKWEDAIKNPSQDGEIVCMSQGLLDTEENPTHCLVAVGKMEAPKIIRDISSMDLGKNEYLSRHSLEAKYLYVDNKAASIIGYLPSEVIGCSAYDFYHLDDLSILSVNHKNLMNHGNSATMFYRFLTKGQQWIWMQTHGYVETNKWTNKPETIICHNVVVSYSKVLEYLHQRALEYGPALPPVTLPGSSRTPQEVLIGALTVSHRYKPQILSEDRISDVTPTVHKEEPPSPPTIGAVQQQPTGHYQSPVLPIPENLYPRQNIYHIAEAPEQQQPQQHSPHSIPQQSPHNTMGQGYSKMEVDISPGSVQSNDHNLLQHQDVQQLQHLHIHRGPVINLPTQQQVPQQVRPVLQQQQQIHVQQHVQQQQPVPQVNHLQHQVPAVIQVAAGEIRAQLPQNGPIQLQHQGHQVQQQQPTQIHVQQQHQQQPNTQQHQQQHQPLRQIQQQTNTQQQQPLHSVVQQAPLQQQQPVPTVQASQQGSTVQHFAPQHNSQPATPLSDNSPTPMPPQERRVSPQVLLLPQTLSVPQQTYIANSPQPNSQLRPTINLQGMHYINVSNNIDTKQNTRHITTPNTVSATMLSPTTPQPVQVAVSTHDDNIHYALTSPNNMKQHYTTSQISQPYSIIPTTGGGTTIQPNSNVIMIQQPITGQYQFAQLYPLIQAVNPTNGTVTTTIPHKLAAQNGTHIDMVKTSNAGCYPVPLQTVKREQSRCAKSPLASILHPPLEKAVFRSNSDDYLSSANSDHVLDQFDPEVISMILSNTNIDNFNLDNQWNPNLFDNPPKSTHSTSSNPSPISTHSPGT